MAIKITDPRAKVSIPGKYNPYYKLLRESISLKNPDILFITAALGFYNDKKVSVDKEKSTTDTLVEIRAEYLQPNQEWIYLLLNKITEGQLFKNYDEISEDFGKLMNGPFLEYANGGMELLIEKVLSDYMNHDQTDSKVSTDGLQEAFLHFLWDECNQCPF